MVALTATAAPPLPAAQQRDRRPGVVIVGLALLAATLLLLFLTQQRQRLPLHLARSRAFQPPRDSNQRHAAQEKGSQAPAGSEQGGAGGAGANGAGRSGGSDPPRSPPRNCSLQLEPSPFAERCRLLRDVCVDQGTIVLYSSKDARQLQKGGPGLELIQAPDNRLRFSFEYRAGGRRTRRYLTPAIRVRPAASMEGAAYLRGEPLFSSCTVPVVWYPFERLVNFAHLFRDNAADIFAGLQASPGWRSAAKLVVMTAEGLAMPAWNLDVLQPLSQLRVETWADFTSRLPAAEVAGGRGFVPAGCSGCDEGLPPLSAEGGPQRCFRHMFVCTEGLSTSSRPLHGLGQHLVQYHSMIRKQNATTAADGRSRAAEKDIHAAAAAAADGGSASVGRSQQRGDRQAGAERELRILFHKRGTPDRQLLNAEELVRACNVWRHNSSGVQLRASCAQVELPSLQAGIAAAQEADVFVGMHGANMANAWLMRPGSSMIELHPFGFDGSSAHLQYPLANTKDPNTGVLWWVVAACHPCFSEPGRHEAQGTGKKSSWAKNRNLRLGWPALARVLESIVEVGGDMAEYRRRWGEGRWYWWMHGSGGLTPVGPGTFNQLRCPHPQAAGCGPA